MSGEIDRIKEKIDVVDFLSEYIEVKSAGVNFKALCPFHNEKTPSFTISRERGVWHCFGCGKGGDIFTFLELIESMEFVEALRYFSERTGIPLENTGFDVSGETGHKKNRLKKIHEEALRFYHQFLLKMQNAEPARAYLRERGLSDHTIETWNIGYVPDQWSLLTDYLLRKNYAIDDLLASGLTVTSQQEPRPGVSKRYFDRFRGRIMFPLHNELGDCVGFTGRLLHEDATKHVGKYINSPQTLIYDKSKMIFGLHLAKNSIRIQKKVVVVEGQMDVISSHQAGITNVVASSGTALTDEQVGFLKRYADSMLMSFDMDEAGKKAALRGIDTALARGMYVKVIRLPEGAGKDPDECVRKNKEIWIEAIQNATDILPWIMDLALEGKDLSSSRDRQSVVDFFLPRIGVIPHVMEREAWLVKLADLLQTTADVLRDELKKNKSAALLKNNTFRTRNFVSVNKNSGVEIQPEKKEPNRVLAEKIIGILLFEPSFFEKIPFEEFGVILSTFLYTELYEIFRKAYNHEQNYSDNGSAHGSDEKMSKTEQIILLKTSQEFSDLPKEKLEKELTFLYARLKKDWIFVSIRKLQAELTQAEKDHDTVHQNTILAQIQLLQKNL